MKKVGIIGANGSFGLFLAEKLAPFFEILTYSRSVDTDEQFDRVAKCDYLILSIPLAAYEAVSERLKGKIAPNTIIIDVCSVKQRPIALLKGFFPEQELIATHPLFGPQSASSSLSGHTVILCKDVGTIETTKKVGAFLQSLGLQVVEKSAEEHDKLMADLQALTFFVARGLWCRVAYNYDTIISEVGRSC
jgi:prephenate dehydrogenase